MPKKKSKKKEVKVKEYFEVEKEGKEKIVEAEGKIEEKIENVGQKEKENKQLIIILVIAGFLIAMVLGWYFFSQSLSNIENNGVKYNVIDEMGITFYNTNFSVIKDDKLINYNVYIRNDPRDLSEEIPFEGNLRITSLTAIKMENEEQFSCDGDGTIAIANLQQVLRDAVQTNVVKDPEAECSENGEYTLISIVEGEENKISELSKSCYEVQVKDCDIIKSTERVIVEIVETINFNRL